MIKAAVFASGTGTNAIKLFEKAKTLKNIQCAILVVDQPGAGIIKKVKEEFPEIEVLLVDEKSRETREQKIIQELRSRDVTWCFLAGFMRILSQSFLDAFKDPGGYFRVVNIHPSLLPAYPGLNSYERAFEAKEARSGVTVHLVDGGVDTGPILIQESFAREPQDTLESFIQKGKRIEWSIYPKVLEMIDQNVTLMAIPSREEGTAQLFWIYYSREKIDSKTLTALAPRLTDAVDQGFWVNPTAKEWSSFEFDDLQVISFLPGVTDNPARAFSELLAFESCFQGRQLQVSSGEAVFLKKGGRPHVINKLIHQEKRIPRGDDRLSTLNFKALEVPKTESIEVKTLSLHGLSDEDLGKLSADHHWALTVDEMKVIQAHYGDRKITDVEIEVLAQTWSEHCKHKIFRAEIEYIDKVQPSKSGHVRGLFKDYIQGPTEKLKAKKDWLISVFNDNAGIVRFHENVDVCIKVETHNSPSALDPYGGALTGILGVNRDILGTGLGAKPIANTNVLCFGNPAEQGAIPVGLFHPRDVLKGVHKGIQDGGNKSGIPTVNGAMIFDESFAGKPLVYCGTLGVMPQTVTGRPSAEKGQKPGDLVVVCGGSVGLDGIHGATSSSLGLDSTTPTGMVQIGDPLTQKRVLDFILIARDQGLYSSITDNGAGGISSSVGEMAGQTNGAKLDLSLVPLKYPGLMPWQIMVSESQERMTMSVPPAKKDALLALAKQMGVQINVIGEFTASGKLEVFYRTEKVADLSLAFLHDGLPKMKLKATWSGPRKTAIQKNSLRLSNPMVGTPSQKLLALAAHPSLASKERWVRQYDHEVQSATAVKPFEGFGPSAPNDGGVIWMGAHGGGQKEGTAIGSGICPHLSDVDPEWMAINAVDEAVRNVMVTGADPSKVALCDNFCWPDPLPGEDNPEAEQKLAELVRTCRGLADTVLAYEMPLVSGKDSMKNDFKGQLPSGEKVKISVLPTLLVTAIAHHPDVTRALKPHAKPGSVLYLLGRKTTAQTFNAQTARKFYESFFRATQKGVFQSAHDVSEGGMIFAAMESVMLHRGGLKIQAASAQEANEWFEESPAQILVSVDPSQEASLKASFDLADVKRIGIVDTTAQLELQFGTSRETVGVAEFEARFRGAV
ncbi:MAG: phosphoribosylformylglycinamidine synthase [Bdellovibrionales bacterium]|nr:phosphoribosylformylglycinamidine synthase [Bdellovibrionales bacterium]